jgi:hypothetical protein
MTIITKGGSRRCAALIQNFDIQLELPAVDGPFMAHPRIAQDATPAQYFHCRGAMP